MEAATRSSICGTEPVRWWIFDKWFDPLSIHEESELRVWDKWEAHYDNDVERGKKTSRSFDEMPAKIRTAFIKMRHPDTVAEFRKLTGIETLIDDPHAHGAGLHQSDRGSFLQVHLDYAVHPIKEDYERVLNLLFFAHTWWEKSWGGQLLLTDVNGKTITEIDPVPGRLAVFEVSDLSYHGVRVVGDCWNPRTSCAVYYLAKRTSWATRRRAMFFPNRGLKGVPLEVR